MLKWKIVVVGLAGIIMMAGLKGLIVGSSPAEVLPVKLTSDADELPVWRDDLTQEVTAVVEDDGSNPNPGGASNLPDAGSTSTNLGDRSVGVSSIGATTGGVQSQGITRGDTTWDGNSVSNGSFSAASFSNGSFSAASFSSD
jgi:hypothetical protein